MIRFRSIAPFLIFAALAVCMSRAGWLLWTAPKVGAQGTAGGLLYASDFANWTLPQGNTPAQGVIFYPNQNICQVTSNGFTFVAPKVGRPLTIVDGANTETVTPTVVSIGSSGCMISATMTHSHSSYYLRSGTAGAQEAIDYQASQPQGANIVLTPAWTAAGGNTGIVTGTLKGNTGVTLLDQRSSQLTSYTWNGSNYTATHYASVDNAAVPGNCAQIGANNTITGTGAPCSSGAGSVSGGTANALGKYTSATAIGAPSGLSDNGTTITSTEPVAGTSATFTGNILTGGVAAPTPAPLGTVSSKCMSSPSLTYNPICYGAIGDGNKHPLSSVTSLGSTNTALWTLAQWQTIFPFATSLSNEIDRLGLQLMSNTVCSKAGAGGDFYVPGAYWLDFTWDVANYQSFAPDNLQCTVRINGGTPNSISSGAFFWDGPNATGVQTIASASGGTLCVLNGCQMTLTGFNGGCNNVNFVVTLPTGGSWTGATFGQESGGDSCTSAPTTATITSGGSGTVTLTGAVLGHYGATPMLSFTNCQNCVLENITPWGGNSQTSNQIPNGIDWHEGFHHTAVNTHNVMRNIFAGGTARVSPFVGLYNCFEWTGANSNNDQMYLENLNGHDCYDTFVDPTQQSVLIEAHTMTSTNAQDAVFVLNANWKIDNENGDNNPVTFRFTDGIEFGTFAAGQGKFILSNIHPEQDGQFINIGTSQGIDVNVEGGSWANTGSWGVNAITSASGGTICQTNGCQMTLTTFNQNCTNTNYTATLPTGGSWAGATFTSVSNGFNCNAGFTPTTAVLSNGGSGTVTIVATILENEFIDVHGATNTMISLDHFNLFGTPGKINLSTGGNAVVKLFSATNTGGTAPFLCRPASSDSDATGMFIVSPVDSSGQRYSLNINGVASDFCSLEFGSGNSAQTIGANQNAQKGSGKNYIKNGNLSYTLGCDFNSACDYFIDTQNGNVSFQVPQHRWAWDSSGAEASPDTGSGSTLCLKRFIGSGSGTNVMCFDRTTGIMYQASQAPIASADPIAPTSEFFHVTGTATINTITPPSGCITSGFMCQITIIPDGLWSTGITGNIAIATTAVVSKALIMTYDPATSKWYPSY